MGCFIKLLLLPFYIVYGVCAFIFEIIKEIFNAIFKSTDNQDKRVFVLPPPVPNTVTNGQEYEYFVAEYLRRTGYSQVTVTKGSGDYGVDILATKNGIKYAVQCKYYSSPVSLKAVQEVVAGAPCYGCNAAMVVTNTTFTKSAIKLAAANGVTLLSYVNSLPPIINERKSEIINEQRTESVNEQKPKFINNKEKWIIISVIYIISIIAFIGLYYGGLDNKGLLKYIGFETLILAIIGIIDLIKHRKHLSFLHKKNKRRKQNNDEYYYVPENNSSQTSTPDTQNNNNEITETESNESYL